MSLTSQQEQIYEMYAEDAKTTKDPLGLGKSIEESLCQYPKVVQKLKKYFPNLFLEIDQSKSKKLCISEIFDIFLPKDQKIQNQKFVFIYKISSKQFFQELDKREEEYSNQKFQKPLFQILLPEVMNRLISSQDFDKIFDHNIFAKYPNSSLYKFTVRGFLIFIIERLGNASKKLINLYSKIPKIPIPFIYKLDQNRTTICLKQISSLLINNCLNLISIGNQNCGKSTLLNQIFHTKCQTNSNNIFHEGVDIVFHTSQFEQKFNLFDFQGDVLKNKEILKLITYIIPNFYIIIQISDLKKYKEILQYLKIQCKVKVDKLMIILRDAAEDKDGDLKRQLKMLNFKQKMELPKGLFQIKYIKSSSVVYRNNLSTLQKDIHNMIWKQVNEILQQKKTCNHYWNYENKIYQYYQEMLKINRNQRQNITHINAHLSKSQNLISLPDFCQYQILYNHRQFQDFSNMISADLKQIDQKSISSTLFPFLTNRRQLDKINLQINQIQGEKRENQEKHLKLLNIKKKIGQSFQNCKIHKLVSIFHSLICNKQTQKRLQFEALLTSWQAPLLSPEIKSLSDLKTNLKFEKDKIEQNQQLLKELNIQREKKEKKINSLQENDKVKQFLSQSQIVEIKALIYQLQQKIKIQVKKIQEISVNRQHFWRQIIFIYENKGTLKNIFTKYNWLNLQQKFIQGCCYYIRNGGQFELLDGDNYDINENHLNKIFKNLHPDTEKNEQLFVISIIGPQSTGKSTLLNFLLKTAFQMSAGRCTNGLYASLLKTDFPKARDCLVLDSEGLLSIERSDEHFDRMLTILAMSLSNVMIINVNGQMGQAMKKILEISLYAANQLRLNMNKRPIIFFVLRNMIDDDKVKQSQMIKKLGQQFQKIALISKVSVKHIIDYRDQKSFQLMFSAYNKDKQQIEGRSDNLTICVVNNSFRIKCAQLRSKIFQQAKQSTSIPYQNLIHFQKTLKQVWTCIKQNSDLTQYENVKQVQDDRELSKKVLQNIQVYIESDKSNQQTMAKDIDSIVGKMHIQNMDFINIKKEIIEKSQQWQQKLLQKFQQISKNYKIQLRNTYKLEIKRKIFTLSNIKIQEAKQKFNSLQSKKIVRNVNISSIMENLKKDFQKERKEQIDIQQKIQKYKKQFTRIYDNQSKIIQRKLLELRKQKDIPQMIYQVSQLLKGQRKFRNQQNILLIMNISGSFQKLKKAYNNSIPFEEKHKFKRDQEKICINFYLQKIKSLKQQYYENRAYLNISPQKSQSILTKFEKTVKSAIKSIGNQNKLNCSNQQENNICISPRQFKYLEEFIFQLKIEPSEKIYERIKKKMNIIFLSETMFMEINPMCIRVILPQIQIVIRQIDKQLTNTKVIHLDMQKIKQWITDYLLKQLAFKKMQILQSRHFKTLNQFINNKNPCLKDFVIKIRSTLGDEDCAKKHSKQLKNIIIALIIKKLTFNFTEKIKQFSISSESLMEKADQYAFELIKAKNKSALLKYSTEMDHFCLQIFNKQFQNTLEGQKRQILQNENTFQILLHQKTQNLLERMEKLVQKFQELIGPTQEDILNQKIKNASAKDSEAEEELNKLALKVCQMVVKYLFVQNIQEQYQFISLSGIMKKQQIISDNYFQINSDQKQIYNIFLETISSDKIKNAKIYSKQLLQSFKKSLKLIKFRPIQMPDIVYQYKNAIQVKALGCTEKCPYCGIKCKLQANHVGKHQSIRHRMMGLNKSYQEEDNVYTLLRDYCNSQNNFHKSRWASKEIKQPREVKNRQISSALKQRLKQNQADQHKFNFTLTWDQDFNPVDLDLHVVCPCETQIYWKRRKCQICGGFLDDDHRYDPNPIEHVYFDNPKLGQYRSFIRYFNPLLKRIEKQCTLTIHQYSNDINHSTFLLKPWQNSPQIVYSPGDGITFSEHLQNNFNKWSITIITKQRQSEYIKYEEYYRQILKILEPQLIDKIKNG